jgi:hypothetical protein
VCCEEKYCSTPTAHLVDHGFWGKSAATVLIDGPVGNRYGHHAVRTGMPGRRGTAVIWGALETHRCLAREHQQPAALHCKGVWKVQGAAGICEVQGGRLLHNDQPPSCFSVCTVQICHAVRYAVSASLECR